MNTKSTPKVSLMGISILILSFLFIGSNNLLAQNDCDNETTVSGHVKKVVSNNGVKKANRIKGAADHKGAQFYDNNDRMNVELNDEVAAGQELTVTWKMRHYNSSYSGPSKLKVYESKDGNSFDYNSTLTTYEKHNYITNTLTLNEDTKYLKLVNKSSHNNGSPDFLVDAVSYNYTICNDHCPNGPEPGTPCDDGDALTSNDVINDNCECEGTQVSGGTFTVCSQIETGRDDAEEDLLGNVDTGSGDLELIFDNADGDQIVGLRFNGLEIPQGATVTSAFIQFTADATIGIDPCNLDIYGEASDNAAGFLGSSGNISSRSKTNESVLWSPVAWTNGDAGADQQSVDISTVIQEIVDRVGYTFNSSMVIIIEGEGKRTAKSFDGDATGAAILCVTYSEGCHDSDNDGVCDEDDICEGFDDNIDVDGDGTPDGCDDCLNEIIETGNVKKDLWNWGVHKAKEIKHAPNNKGAQFYDNPDRIYVKLDDEVAAGEQLTVTWKRRNYHSSYSGPSKLDVYESKNGYIYNYNSTLTTEELDYIGGTLTVDDDTRYLKLVNGSTYYSGSPDFLVDAVSYDYRICDEVEICPNAPLPGTPCDDGNNLTINDVIQPNCECAGTPLSNYNVCAKISNSSDDAEENSNGGGINLTSGDIELLFDNGNNAYQIVGLRFLNLNIPNGAIVNNAYIQFTSEATVNQDPSSIDIYGEASDNAVTFTNTVNNISNRAKTSAFVNWSPPTWETTGIAGPDQQTLDISSVIQEIVDRPGFNSSSAVSIIIEGIGKRTAVSFNYNADQAAELCVSYSAPLQGGSAQGMTSNDSNDEIQGAVIGSNSDDLDPDIEMIEEVTNLVIEEDVPETKIVTPNSVSIFPIPVSKDLNVDLANHEGRPARISVYNQIGQLQEIIDVESIPASPVQINVRNYQNGAFYMTINIENEDTITKKFIVNRSY